VVFFVYMVVKEHATVKHDRIVFLSNLITLGKIGIVVVLAIKLDVVRDATAQGQTAADSFVKAVFIQNWKHTGEA
jgi:hypothetical protein